MTKKLEKYQSKRDFKKTSEPRGKTGTSGKKRIFVVQYHEARAKHYDFRLAWQGVLLSWAVPKGPSTNPADKRLAVMVEDHPLEYANFEGVIPKGNYGAGTVKIWDKGEWEPVGDFGKGLKSGSLKFILCGEKLCGKWALVRMKGEEDKNWLLIKEKSAENPFDNAEVQLAKLVTDLPKGDDWLYEVKYDGYRIAAYAENGKVRLMTRNGYDFGDKFSVVKSAIETWADGRAMVLDGEMVVTDENGVSDFQKLQNYVRKKNGQKPEYKVFDILALDGRDLRELPLIERKKILENLLADVPEEISFVGFVKGKGKDSFAAAKKLGLEGIVGKKADSPYAGNRNGDWIKIKCYKRQEFVIGGYTLSEKKSEGVSSLLLGVHEGGKLVYSGRAGTGIDPEIIKEFGALSRKTCPFDIEPKSRTGEKIFWLKPSLVAEIQFAEYTQENLLRQASFKGLRYDKSGKEVTNESSSVCGVEISSPERIVYENPKINKLEVAKYYEKVAERMLKYIKGRFISSVRCHDGVSGECFFKKHPAGKSDGIGVKEIKNDKGEKNEYFYITDKTGIISEVQLGTVEFHAWGSKASAHEKPDILVFDLDPEEGLGLDKVRQGAKDLKSILDELGLKSYLKTSGGKGYHIVVPFDKAKNWDEFHDFAKSVAALMEEKWPERYTANIRKEKRKGKIFIDWARNGKGATSVAPYSLRAREGAAVSMPIKWDELDKTAPNGIDMYSALERLKKPDPWN